jgi:hypothetical protein
MEYAALVSFLVLAATWLGLPDNTSARAGGRRRGTAAGVVGGSGVLCCVSITRGPSHLD